MTVSRQKNIESANLIKTRKYLDLTSNIRKKEWIAENGPFIGGSGGTYNKKKFEIYI